MQPKSQDATAFELFQAHFDQILNTEHPLIQLGDRIDWARFDAAFADSYSEDLGAPGKATRLMVGLQYLKSAFDESVVDRWVENPYWQYFCGFSHMQHEAPIDPSSMSRWRKRVGADRLELLLKETIDLAVRTKQLPRRDLKRVTVDTTVQEKNITHPTDSKLLYTAICRLGDAANERGIRLRQSYIRVGKRASVMASRYTHAKQFRRMRRQLRKLRTYVGRMIRDIERKTLRMEDDRSMTLAKANRLRNQQPTGKNKLYSWHEPEVKCISKGKAHKRYEFGQKAAVATTNRSNWFVAARLMKGNPYDGHAPGETLAAVESVTDVAITDAYVDKGYRGHGCKGSTSVHIAGSSLRNVSRSERKRRRRRSAIEPKIGHLKSDHRMRRCFLSGLEGDAINIFLAAAAANLRKLLAGFFFARLASLTTLIWPHDRLIGIADSLASVAQHALPTRI
ncbi:MAG: IS5 family transposase, partial [Planctomycetes bacterium]|nr:IS5 family transposase [Planctomycetota bacterium]